MGLLISRLFELFDGWSTNPARILMLGLDAAGKTTVLYKIKLNETITSIPTIGFNVETVTPVKGLQFTVWDIGGQHKIRPLWKRYTENSDGLIYVVDSADRERMSEAREELFSILEGPEMLGVPVCVLANKQDLPNALKPSAVIDEMHLRDLRSRKWHVQGVCATSGEGVFEAMDNLASMVKEFQNTKGTYS